MTTSVPRTRRQFQIRSILMVMTYLALVLAVCVQYQRTSSRQRAVTRQIISGSVAPVPVARPRGLVRPVLAPLPSPSLASDTADGLPVR